MNMLALLFNNSYGTMETFSFVLFLNNFCTVLGVRWFLLFESISAALENTLSQGTDEAVAARKIAASSYKLG